MSPHRDTLVYWITERENMRQRKENGMAPEWVYGYSDDYAMGTVRYCNVRREDDKVTRWLAQNWRPYDSTVTGAALARFVNHIPTLQNVVRLTLPEVNKTMKHLREEGDKIWTGVYTISTCGQKVDKVDYVTGVLEAVTEAEARGVFKFESLETTFHELTSIKGIGSFLAGQVIADLKNTPDHPLQAAPDWYTWSCHGPGSIRGLSIYHDERITPKMYRAALQKTWKEIKGQLPDNLVGLHPLTMQDLQNCMCEFSKFYRVMQGGRSRNVYRAG